MNEATPTPVGARGVRPGGIARTVIMVAGAMLTMSAASSAAAQPSDAVCATRVNDSAAKLVECIRRAALWKHMVAFQRIADQNPGPDGHGNRDTGQPGYKASVKYVAALMKAAGYRVTIQPYVYTNFRVVGVPTLATATQKYVYASDWYVARLSGQGSVRAPLQPVGTTFVPAGGDAQDGCAPSDYTAFVPGRVALIHRGACSLDAQVAIAEAAGAAGVIIYSVRDPSAPSVDQGKGASYQGAAYQANLTTIATIPVVAVASYEVGASLLRQYAAGHTPIVRLDVRAQYDRSDIDYNLVAESRFGDPRHVVVVEGHLDAIYGAGMLDNASGSTTILELALKMAKTPTRNQLRFIWFGGEELGLLGSRYYTQHLTSKELRRIVFDIDAERHGDAELRYRGCRPKKCAQREKVSAERRAGLKDRYKILCSVLFLGRLALVSGIVRQ